LIARNAFTFLSFWWTDTFGAIGLCKIGKINPMSKEDEYRKNAAKTIDLAQHATSTRDKGRLLALAEKWLDLGDRVHQRTSVTQPNSRASVSEGQAHSEAE
jgi:hypothetical protein